MQQCYVYTYNHVHCSRDCILVILYLNRSKQQAADMKEVSTLMKESVWVEDKDINDCQGCKKPFSVSRRKVQVNV